MRRGISYADNFAFNRRDPWTHSTPDTGVRERLERVAHVLVGESGAPSPEMRYRFLNGRPAAQRPAPASAATSAIITKKLGFAMPLQKPPRKPARMSPGSVVANQTPIITERAGGGRFRDQSEPDGRKMQLADGGEQEVAREPERAALPAAVHAAAAITR